MTENAAQGDDLRAAARVAARAGAEIALSWWRRRNQLLVEEKAASDDLVSRADHETEEAIREVLARMRPGDGIVGEELDDVPGSSGLRWYVDPIDGTTNYLYGRAEWAVSVAAVRVEDGRPLAAAVAEPAIGLISEASLGGGTRLAGRTVFCNPATDLSRALVEVNLGHDSQRDRAAELFEALAPRTRDVRRGGSAACALAQVASGRADAYWGPGLRPWDVAAGRLLVSEAGGSVGDLTGESASVPEGRADVLAAAPALYPELQALLAAIYETASSRG
jgi:myo-inositol-1(or 4)-monophosphatase